MCRSKEAWEHFVFVPSTATPPSQRRVKAAGHKAFLDVALTVGPVPGAKGAQARHVTFAAGRRRAAVERLEGPAAAADVSAVGVAAAMLAGGSGAAGVASVAGASLVKLGMMVAPPPPPPPLRSTPTQPALAPAGAARDQERERDDGQGDPDRAGGFLNLLLPGFDTDTFIWRVSMLQLTEYAGSLLLGSALGTPKICSLYLLGASWGPSIAAGAFWRLLFPIMLHANPLHIFYNVFFQLRIGFGMEKQFGRRKFCLLYLFCGFLGNLLSVVSDPMKLAVGASTSGFGLLGVWAAEVLLTWDLLGASRPRLFLWFAFMLVSCVMMSTISPSVDFVGHAGGAFAGFLLAIIMADMQEQHQPAWYGSAKTAAKHTALLVVAAGLFKAIVLGPDGPFPYCGSIFYPRQLPF